MSVSRLARFQHLCFQWGGGGGAAAEESEEESCEVHTKIVIRRSGGVGRDEIVVIRKGARETRGKERTKEAKVVSGQASDFKRIPFNDIHVRFQ